MLLFLKEVMSTNTILQCGKIYYLLKAVSWALLILTIWDYCSPKRDSSTGKSADHITRTVAHLIIYFTLVSKITDGKTALVSSIHCLASSLLRYLALLLVLWFLLFIVKEKECENCIWEHAHRLISSSQCDRILKRITGSAGHGNKISVFIRENRVIKDKGD